MMTATWQIPKADKNGVTRIAELIALKLRAGDVVTLAGDLGAGKTTLARALIRAVLNDPALEVPSPTFALLQSYSEGRIAIAHLDLYRIAEGEEIAELALEDWLKTGALLVEWPQHLPPSLYSDRLAISLADADHPDERQVTLTGTGSWSSRLDRLHTIHDFLSAHSNWNDARIVFMQGDASTRSYARLIGGSAPALLMDSPARSDGPIVRDGKTYSQLADLAETVHPFAGIATALNEAGIHAPEVFAAQLDEGLLIIEDLGQQNFRDACAAGLDQSELWQAATDVLISLRQDIADHTWSFPDDTHHRLPVFSPGLMHTESELLLDWYWPHLTGTPAPDDVRADFKALCMPIFENVSKSNRHWVLRDFHSPNLILRSVETGMARVGVIDFQDALRGPAEYDLVSLLQDARVDVPSDLEERLFKYYCEHAANKSGHDIEPFDTQETLFRFCALGAQRNMKILGIFARLANRDGKPQYLTHLPRIWRYLTRNLDHPDLKDLKRWMDRHFPSDVRIAKSVS